MNITLVTPTYPDKGISEYADHLIAALMDKLEHINVVSYKKIYPNFLYPVKGGGLRIKPEYNQNVTIQRIISWWNPLSWFKASNSAKTRIVHCQWVTHFLFPAIISILVLNKLRGKINIITVHNVLSHESKKISFAINKVVFGFCDHFIVHNKKNKKQLIDYFKIAPEKISIVPIGINHRTYKKYEKNKARRKINLRQDRRYILFIGHIRKYKGLDILLQAFAQIAGQRKDVDLIVAGTAWSKWDKYEQIIKKLRISDKIIREIKFLSEDEMSLYLSAADFVVMPYRHFDGSSALLKTALYFKIPIIGSDIDDFRECLPAKNLFQTDSVSDLAKKINYFLDFESKKERETKHNFDWDISAQEHIKIYAQYDKT